MLDWDVIIQQTIQNFIDGLNTIFLNPGMMALYKDFLISAIVAGVIALVVTVIFGVYFRLAGDSPKSASRKAKRNADIIGPVMDLWDLWRSGRK